MVTENIFKFSIILTLTKNKQLNQLSKKTKECSSSSPSNFSLDKRELLPGSQISKFSSEMIGSQRNKTVFFSQTLCLSQIYSFRLEMFFFLFSQSEVKNHHKMRQNNLRVLIVLMFRGLVIDHLVWVYFKQPLFLSSGTTNTGEMVFYVFFSAVLGNDLNGEVFPIHQRKTR